MEIRHSLQTYCFIQTYFILAHLFGGQSIIITKNEEMVYVLPGEDVTLTCSILKEEGVYVTQTQWSKVSDIPTRIVAVHNPRYGTIFLEKVYSYSVSFTEDSQHCMPDFNHSNFTVNYTKCYQWILQFKNVSLEISGKYECSFAIFPDGTSSSEINLVVTKPDVKSSVVEALLNQTLEIPCVKDLPPANLKNASLTWSLKENKTEETLISKPSSQHITRAMIYKNRIEMNSENMLVISPVSVFDDGKRFICSVAHNPGRIVKSITEVKVFANPEISISFYASSTEKATVICIIKKAFPKPNLLWYLNGEILRGTSAGILIAEDTKVAGGFYEIKSLLTIWEAKQPFLSLTFKCMSIYPFPGNETRNVSSEDIFLPSVGWQSTTMESLKTNSRVTPSLDSLTERPWHSTKNLPNNTQAKHSSTVSQGNPLTRRTELTMQTNQDNLSITDGQFNSTGNLSTNKAVELTTLVNPAHLPTVNTGFNNNGTAVLPGHSFFSWPALVAALLFFCTLLVLLGVRKWCQYKKEILNRPPSFKPPPPPVKYTSMQGFDGIYTSCNELENL